MKRKQAKQNKPSSNKQISSATKLPLINNKKPPVLAPQNIVLNTSSYRDDGLITLIQEYLIKNNLFETLEYFQRDCMKGFKQSAKSIEILKKQLIQAFDTGNRDVFFAKFTQYVPLSMRAKDHRTLKMQFYIQIYFFIYSTHPFLGKKKTIDALSKQFFISYLQGKGSFLAKQQQFLPFYAIAYLQKPQEHQTFKQMFTKKWIEDLKKQLTMYLQKLYPSNRTPTIVTMYDKFIEYNLQADKFSSVALTQPDQEQYYNPIQQQIQQNLQQSIMNNPQPILLQNSNKILNNNSLQKFHSVNPNNNSKVNKQHQQQLLLANQKDQQQQQLISQKENEDTQQYKQRIKYLQEEKDGLLKVIEYYKNKYNNLQNDFKEFSESIKNILQDSQNKWFKIIQELYNMAMDLLHAANTLQQGIPLPDPQILIKRSEKLERYKNFVNMNIQDLLSDNVADYSLFERPQHDVSVDIAKKNFQYNQRDQKFIEIDFQKIKSVLITVPQKQASEQSIKELNLQKCLILQALRWRWTRIRGAFQKREVVLSYTLCDVLGINQGKKTGKKDTIINVLLNSQNQMILLETTLLISALCKDYYGRQYLFDEGVMKKMMQLRKKPDIDQRIKEIILVILQFQSNKRICQDVMIDNGLIEQMVEKLEKERDHMTPFIMEYVTAILLNLLLSKKGLERAESIRSQVLMALINLMEIQHAPVKSFVHASLYPLLSKKVFRQKALQFGMQENIKYLIQNNGPQFQHQLRYLYQRLMLQDDVQDDRDEDPDFDQIDDQEIGEDVQFIIEEISSSLSGQFLLMKKYPLTGPDAMQQMSKIKDQVRQTLAKVNYYDKEHTEIERSQRLSIQTPLLGRGRKSQIQQKFGHNASVYSNKSSNRILRSQKNSRIKNPNTNKTAQKQRLDTVHQNASEASLKQYRQQSKDNYRSGSKEIPRNRLESTGAPRKMAQQNTVDKHFLQNNSFEKAKKNQNENKDKIIEDNKHQSQKQQSPLKDSFAKDYDQKPIIVKRDKKQQKQGIQGQNKEREIISDQIKNNPPKKLKPYEENQQYVKAFQTRTRLVRTPPQK